MKKWAGGWRILLLYAIIGTLVFGRVYGAGFVTDFLGWLECPQQTTFWELHTCFGNRGLYFVPFLLLHLLTKLCFVHPLCWLVVFLGAHVGNAFLTSRLCHELFAMRQVDAPVFVPALAGLIFLIQPYQVEVVAWKACINYLAATALLLGTLLFYLQFLKSRSVRSRILSCICFAAMLFTLEFALVVPLLLIDLHFLHGQQKSFRQNILAALEGIWPFLVLIGVLVAINLLVLEKAVGHYEIDVAGMHPLSLASAELKYWIKTVGFLRFWSYPTQSAVYTFCESTIVSILVLAAIAGAAVIYAVGQRKLIGPVAIRVFAFLAFVLLLLPIAHLYFYYLQLSENDRYTYLAMVFFSILIASFWGTSRIGKALVAVYCALALLFATKMVSTWRQSHKVHEQLVETFRWESNSEVYILNLPDNLKGVFMFRNIGGVTAFEEALTLLKGREIDGKIYDVFQYNMATPSDGVTVNRLSEDSFKVTFNQWGNWWWRNGMGGTEYENGKFKASPDGQSYVVKFKDLDPDAAIIWFDGVRWQEVMGI